MSTMIVDKASETGEPCNAIDNPSTPSNAGGNTTGKESTGKSAPFPFAFAMIAAIAVMAEAMQMLNKITMIQKRLIFPTLIEGRKNKNRLDPVNDNARDRKHVNKNFPKKTSIGVELSFNKREVPRSSSMTNVLERPVMLPKNNTIHNNAEAT